MITVILDGKPAYKINAKFEGIKRPKAALYKCGTVNIWMPFSVSKYNEAEETILIHTWYYDKNIKYSGTPHWKHA